MGLDWIAEEGLPQGRFGFVASRRFFLPRPLSRGQRPEGKSPGFSESPEIGSCISFTEQQQVLEAALAYRQATCCAIAGSWFCKKARRYSSKCVQAGSKFFACVSSAMACASLKRFRFR